MTIFERIINHEIPATIEYEDAEVIAIRDIAPNAPVHILIIPKERIASVNDLNENNQAIVGKIFLVARDLAKKYGIAESGYRVVTNVNEHAGQTVFHLHFHLLGGVSLGAMNALNQAPSGQPDAPTTTPQPPTSEAVRRRWFSYGTIREVSVFVLASIGLAIGFNRLNPRQITWVKPPFTSTVATDSMLGLPSVEAPPSNPTNATETAEKSTDLREEKNNQQPNSNRDVGYTDAHVAVVERTEKRAPAFKAQPGVVLEINYSQFERLLSAPHFLIDARTPETYNKGHIGSATNVYGGEVEGRIPELLGMVPTDRAVIIYCDGGECELSHHVANALKQFGYGPIYIFTGGWAEWSRKKPNTH